MPCSSSIASLMCLVLYRLYSSAIISATCSRTLSGTRRAEGFPRLPWSTPSAPFIRKALTYRRNCRSDTVSLSAASSAVTFLSRYWLTTSILSMSRSVIVTSLFIGVTLSLISTPCHFYWLMTQSLETARPQW